MPHLLENARFYSKSWMPLPLFDALSYDEYDKGEADYSITELLKPPQMVQIERRYHEQIKIDIQRIIPTFRGRALHHYIERMISLQQTPCWSEMRLIHDIDGIKVSGQIDIAFSNENGNAFILDAKDTQWNSWLSKGPKPEWNEQGNGYSYLFWRETGIEVAGFFFAVFIKNWSYNDAFIIRKHDYPKEELIIQEGNLWSLRGQENFLKERIALHEEAKDLPDEELPPCSIEERWGTEDRYAVIFSSGRSKGKAVPKMSSFKTYEEAEIGKQLAKERQLKKKESERKTIDIEFRMGDNKRCDRGYCSAAPFCPQYRNLREQLCSIPE